MADDDFDAFVRHRGRDLRRTAYLITGNVADADDLVQLALLQALPRWAGIVGAGDPYPYVARILVNARRSWWRRHGRYETVVSSLPDRHVADVQGRSDDREAIVRALRTLPLRQRVTVVLRYYSDLSESETARTMGCSVGTVKSQCSKALAGLRVQLADVIHNSSSQESSK